MGADPPSCAICLDTIDITAKFAQPLPCLHIFHCNCMNQWLQRNRSCPLCRYPIQLHDQARWYSLFATALLISHEACIDRFLITTEFLQLVLKKYKSAAEWTMALPYLISFISQFQHLGVRFPCLDISTRTMAHKELTKWKLMFKEYTSKFPFEKKRKTHIKEILQQRVIV